MDKYKVHEQEHYDAIYSSHEGVIDDSLKRTVLRRSEAAFDSAIRKRVLSSSRVLEVGCGVAPVVICNAIDCAELFMADISMQALRVVAGRIGKTEQEYLCQMDAEKLAFKDDSFDVVIDNEFLSSVNPAVAISELLRVLKPDGILIAKETLAGNPLFRLNRLRKVRNGQMQQWVADHIFHYSYLENQRYQFKVLERQNFHLFALLAVPVLDRIPENKVKRILSIFLDGLDLIVLKLPLVKKLGFKTVFILRKET